MAGICYFIPGAGQVNIDQLKALGLDHAFDDGFSQRGANDGPSKTSGVVIANTAAMPAQFGYFPMQQRWEKAKGGAFWIGLDADGDQPKPEQLEREETIAGHNVTLGDGNEWIVPVVRSIVRGSLLPNRHVLDENGKWTTKPMEAYVTLHSQAERFATLIFDTLTETDGETEETTTEPMLQSESRDLAIDALAVNYRISQWEASALGLLTDLTIYNINKAVIDFPTIMEMSKAIEDAETKKKSAPTQGFDSIEDGQQDSNPTTSQPTLT